MREILNKINAVDYAIRDLKVALNFAKGPGPDTTDNLRVSLSNETIAAIATGGAGGAIDPSLIDASGSVRTSSKHITGYYTNLRGISRDLDQEVVGTGAITFAPAVRGVLLEALALDDRAIIKSFPVHPYIPGRGCLYEFTFIGFDNELGSVKRVGAYHSNKVSPFQSNFDGFYLESYSVGEVSTYKVVIANNGTLTEIPREGWYDPLDGTGPSGKTVDFSKFTILRADFLWLGGSRLKMSLYIDGAFIPFHYYYHANNVAGLIFTQSNLPVRAEVFGTTGIASTPSMTFVCSSVSVEDGEELPGNSRVVETGVTATTDLSMATAGVTYLGIALRIKSTYDDVYCVLKEISSLSSSNDDLYLQIIVNPVIAGDALNWADADEYGAIEYAIGASNNIITGGIRTSGVLIEAGSAATAVKDKLKRIGKTLDGTADIIAIALTPASNGASGSVSLTYLQI